MNVHLPFHSDQPVPAEHRSNFLHLYLDIAWFGALNASALSFVAVYAARLGASAFQLGLLGAGPAVVNLLLTLPAGQWLERRPVGRTVFWTAAANRLFYLLWAFLPFLLAAKGQVWALVASTLVMGIPGTALAVGFNALFAGAVPPQWRGHVAGIRNALLAIAMIVVSLLCGQILNQVPFPTGYQVVFGIGFLGAAMSTVHLWFVRPRPDEQSPRRAKSSPLQEAGPTATRTLRGRLRSALSLRLLPTGRGSRLLRTDILRTPFGKLLGVLFAFYLAIQLAVPLFPLQWVKGIHLFDRQIALGQAVFYVSVLAGSTQFAGLTRRLGNQRLAAIGAMFLASYAAFMGLARGLPLFLAGSASGGIGWSLFGGAVINYVLEKVPEDDRPAYLAWYNLAANGALLLGSLAGPLLAGVAGLRVALVVFSVLRFLAAFAILRWE